MPDLELTAALKQAKSKQMFFAFILKGTDGQLLISKTKIPPKAIAEAKKEIGGVPIAGKCSGPIDDMLFQVVKQPPATLGAALKKVVKRETGLTIVPNVQLAGDADGAEPEENGATAKRVDFGPWQAARQKAVNDLKALASKIAGTRHVTAAAVLKEINSMITKLPASPKPDDIDKLEDFVRNDDTITAAEEVPGQFHELSIRKPLLNAFEALR